MRQDCHRYPPSHILFFTLVGRDSETRGHDREVLGRWHRCAPPPASGRGRVAKRAALLLRAPRVRLASSLLLNVSQTHILGLIGLSRGLGTAFFKFLRGSWSIGLASSFRARSKFIVEDWSHFYRISTLRTENSFWTKYGFINISTKKFSTSRGKEFFCVTKNRKAIRI